MDKRFRNLIIIFITVFSIYTLFWVYFLKPSSSNKKLFFKKTYVSSTNLSDKEIDWPDIKDENVLGDKITPVPSIVKIDLPLTYKIDLQPRRQAFNLSCEFASAAVILSYFTNNPDFYISNEKNAEEILMGKVGASQNPNIGIRMGESVPLNDDILYKNLNMRFGGTDYYGVHGAPFIDLFNSYGLKALPLYKNSDLVYEIEKAISSGHLIMTWIRLGYGGPVDVALSYGSVPVVRGEHTIVVNGYDKTGVFAMDPATASNRYIKYEDLLDVTKEFYMPYLEVFPSMSPSFYDPTGPTDKITRLNRSVIKIKVENGSGNIGTASRMAGILKEFGYRVIGIENSDCEDCEGVKVRIKSEFTDYKNLLKNDLKLAFYNIDSFLTDINASNSADVVVTIGR